MFETSQLLLMMLGFNLMGMCERVLFKGIISCLKDINGNIYAAVIASLSHMDVHSVFVFIAHGYEMRK